MHIKIWHRYLVYYKIESFGCYASQFTQV